MPIFTLNINGAPHRIEADGDMPLLWVRRDLLRLTGTKYGCGMGICGACTVHENGAPTRSCQLTVSQASDKSYVTIEGLSANGDHPCQAAWIKEDVAQCGYCQAGMIMEVAALLRHKPSPTDAEIDAALGDHVCRCGTYQRIRKAVHRAAREVKQT